MRTPPRLTKEQAAIIGAYTGVTCGDFGDIQEYASRVLGYPVFTHEFADKEFVRKLRNASTDDFLSICNRGDGQ